MVPRQQSGCKSLVQNPILKPPLLGLPPSLPPSPPQSLWFLLVLPGLTQLVRLLLLSYIYVVGLQLGLCVHWSSLSVVEAKIHILFYPAASVSGVVMAIGSSRL